VWGNSKVRDLLDSMYKGFPVGYLLFWKTGYVDGGKKIGADHKQKPPQLVIVDGQQRLTSLYTVIKDIPVVRDNYKTEKINIAFNPLEYKFEVADAAIIKDNYFIPDISIVWDPSQNIISIIKDYISKLQKTHEVSAEEETVIQNAILKLNNLLNYPLTALELDANISEEDVSDVFVRINSKGTPLNQADFILTLMSVFWDKGRADLETFSRESHVPSVGEASPFNHFIEPKPDQLLRVGISVAFKRARMKYVYSILRGKDLETEKFSTERRDQQFEILKDAQARALNLVHWHGFMSCIRSAGYRSGKMISSQNNLIFSYVLYLIGKTEYHVPEFELRKTITRWFFMSSITKRFTSSPESKMEFDLARLREIKSGNEFIKLLDQISNSELTDDFWDVRLPMDMATSSSRSPSLFAYQAALVLLNAPVLFSEQNVSDLLDPSISSTKSPAERHHLFPKGYLKTLGLTSTKDTNQIANYALVEWGDNNDITDKAPKEYLPDFKKRFNQQSLDKMHHYHALPNNWENMAYSEFLEKRRELMAQVIKEGYAVLLNSHAVGEQEQEIEISSLISTGESEVVEFKSTLRTNLHTNKKDPKMELAILKTLAGFLNLDGGTLVVGVSDDESALGIEIDGFDNEDKMALHLVNIIKSRMGTLTMSNIHLHFEDYQGNRILVVKAKSGSSPVYVLDEEKKERFYIRTGPSTTELTISQTQEYIKQRFK